MELDEDQQGLHGSAYQCTDETADSCPGLSGRAAGGTGPVDRQSMALEDWAVALVVIGSVLLAVICLLSLVYYWFVLRYRVASNSLSVKGKTVIITGASSGIGKATALDLARRGARLILACRNEHKTAHVMNEIRQMVPQGPEILYRHLNLASLQSVREFAKQIVQEESRLDILINNAGMGQEGQTEDGFDLTFGVNHFGPFLLTNLLLDLLKQSAPSRIINLSSLAHKFSPRFDFTEADETGGRRYPRLASYPMSKMAVNLFTHELSRRLANTQVTVCSIHPGIVYTGAIDGLLRRGRFRKLLIPLFRLLVRTPDAGAQCVIHCAVDDSVTQHSGAYFVDCCPCNEAAMATDEALAKELWEVSCQATGL